MKWKAFTGFAVLFIIVVIFIGAVIKFGAGPDELKELEAIEIKEYQGEMLSSVSDFRENSIKGPQHVDIAAYRLEVTGLVASPRSYGYEEVIESNQLYRKLVRLNCVEGWSVKILWEGFLVRDLLAEAGPLPEAKTIIFHTYDGYTTSFPVEYVTDNDILMAYKMNEVIIPPQRGYPFQLVAESKWGYKWIKWITMIDLSDDVNYRGYWESRGYSNEGDLNMDYFRYPQAP